MVPTLSVRRLDKRDKVEYHHTSLRLFHKTGFKNSNPTTKKQHYNLVRINIGHRLLLFCESFEWMLCCTNKLPVQRSFIHWVFQVKWGSTLILRLIRATIAIKVKEAEKHHSAKYKTYCIYHCLMSIALRSINKENKARLGALPCNSDWLPAELHKQWSMTFLFH